MPKQGTLSEEQKVGVQTKGNELDTLRSQSDFRQALVDWLKEGDS